MFRKQDFKKVDLLGSGKKNTKIFKAQHIPSEKYFALKEVEAKTIDKLNEYKEEAVQLLKVKNHPNIIQTYGYYFYETQYNTYRLAIVCEYIDDTTNLERLF
jgi:serine/threonine protein kinase